MTDMGNRRRIRPGYVKVWEQKAKKRGTATLTSDNSKDKLLKLFGACLWERNREMRTRGPIPNESFYKHKNIKSDNYQEPQYLRKRIVYGCGPYGWHPFKTLKTE